VRSRIILSIDIDKSLTLAKLMEYIVRNFYTNFKYTKRYLSLHDPNNKLWFEEKYAT